MAEIDRKALRDMYKVVRVPLGTEGGPTLDERVAAQQGIIEAIPAIVDVIETLRGQRHTAMQQVATLEQDNAALVDRVGRLEGTLLFVYDALEGVTAEGMPELRAEIQSVLG
jgi:hypothetical protein